MKPAILVDLTLDIAPDSPSPPKMPRPTFQEVRTLEQDGCRTSLVTLYNHSGTHVDAFAHFLEAGEGVEVLSLQQCVGPAWVIDLSHLHEGQMIEINDLVPYSDRIEAGSRLLLRTDWDRQYPHESYYRGFPALSLAAARWLTDRKVGLLGIDSGSIAPLRVWDELVAVHQELLAAGVVIVEGLCNLRELPTGAPFDLIVLPIKLAGCDGAPARVIASLTREST